MATPADIVGRARARLGVRFRPQGRGPLGLDCVGLVAAAIGANEVPYQYASRQGSLAEVEAELHRAGLNRAAAMAPGAVLVMNAGPGQLHLGIWTGASLIHADARLRRIVERPGKPPWRVLGIWRFPSDQPAGED